MQRQRIILIVGVILAIVVAFLIKLYLDQQRQIALEEAGRAVAKQQENQIAVLVAKQNIPKGTAMKPEILETKIFPREYVAPQAVTSLDRIAGMIANAPIFKDEQITFPKLSFVRQGGLAEATPVGKRAITINVDSIASVGGMVRPGDYVDLIVTIPVPVQSPEGKQVTQIASIPLFQNVLVLAVGQEMGAISQAEASRYSKAEEGKEQKLYSLITLALNPQEANLVAFVQEQGKFRLVLRSPADSKTEPVRPMSWDALFQYLLPKEAAKETKEFIEPTAKVEIYRGLKREEIPLSK